MASQLGSGKVSESAPICLQPRPGIRVCNQADYMEIQIGFEDACGHRMPDESNPMKHWCSASSGQGCREASQ